MSVVNRTVGDQRPVPLTVTPYATATPVVTLFDDPARTQQHTGAQPAVSGAGSSWSWTLPAGLPAGTYYVREVAQTPGGQVTSDADSLVVAAATIGSSTTDVTVQDVADMLSQRLMTRDGEPATTFDATTTPSDVQVARLILKVAAEETGGLGTIPASLTDMLHSLVSLATAVRVLGVYFSGDSARDDLDADLDKLRDRFRAAVDVIVDTGDPNAVSAEGPGGGSGGEERPPAPAFSFPQTYDPYLQIPVRTTTLRERY